MTKIRGKTVSYALYRKKEKMKLENCFVEDIMKLENELHTTENFDLIEKKKSDLKILRQEKLWGCYIRSKMQWAEEGEKPSFFFINLEAKHFTNKTIPKLVNESGNVITDQNQILQEAKIYYENLYSKRDTVSNINLKNEIPYTGRHSNII